MKKILLIGTVVFSTLSIAQDFNKTSIDFGLGVNKAWIKEGRARRVNFPTIDLGVRHMFSNNFGLKLDLGFDMLKNKGTIEEGGFRTNILDVTISGVGNLGHMMNFDKFAPKLGLLAHAGAGGAVMMSKTKRFSKDYNMTDVFLQAKAGLTVQYKATEKLSVRGDLSVYASILQQLNYDGLPSVRPSSFDGMRNTLTLGVSYYLGSQTTHADWVPNQSGNPAEMEALKAKITKAEKDMMDDDKDGVPNYLDQEAGTAEGANVNTKGQTVKVEKVVDMDGDGILDVNDFCPTIKGAASANGCPDKDGDNVYDFVDKCPNAAGLAADGGCPVVKATEKATMEKAMKGVQFDNGKSTIIKKSLPILDEVAKVMMANPSYKLSIDGHTDNAGDKAKNLQLSEDRAKAVKAYLMGKGVAEGRMKATGYGDSKPKADNKTAKGKAANRRVEFIISFEQ